MIKNYLLVAWRNLVRNKAFSSVNILGLALGLACSILILLWVHQELSYDNFHANGPHIYRITASPIGGTYPLSGAPLAADIQRQIPGIKNTARIKADYNDPVLFSVGDKHFETNRAWYADPSVLQLFSFPLVSGDAATALVRPNGLLLTQQTARRFFGTEDVVGKTIRMNDTVVFTVTGVLKDLPANSHLQFELLLPMSYDARYDQEIIQHHYDDLDFYTYIQLDDKTDASPAALANIGRQISVINHKGEPTFEAKFELQPLSRIHLYSRSLLYDIGLQGNIVDVRIFSIVAIFILLIACINFMNLATARSARRAREVGVRKVIGARRGQLIGQFLGESFLVSFLALLLGLLLVALALPAFNGVLGTSLSLPLDTWFIGGLMGVLLLTSVVAGCYPAFFLSSFRPILVLKTMLAKTGSRSGFFRNGLVVFQFVIAVVLITGTTVVYSQLRFIRNRDLGYDKENLLYLPLKGELGRRLDALTAYLRNDPRLSRYSVLSEVPVNVSMGTAGVHWAGKAPDTHPMFTVMGVDEHFLDLFKIRLATGRGFSTAFPTDTLNYIVNEKALQLLGWDIASAIGKPLKVWDNDGRIIGVVKDFNFKPVQSAIDPLIMRYNPGAGKEWLRQDIVINVPPADMVAAVADLQTIWNKLNPAYAFEYHFVDQQLAQSYQAEQTLGTLFNGFALIAIFISCLGLTGLAAFTAEQRKKEIGIRKVLGANVAGIVSLLSTGFLKLVLIAVVIASPIAWYFMHRWLRDFAYRISLSAWIFVLAGGLALLIAFLTVSFQAVKAARANPVDSLHAD
jgi:putative ABC transport system permease protein